MANYGQLINRPRVSGFATLGDFFERFEGAREQREVRKDRDEAREIQKQDRQLRGQEIQLRTQTIEAQAKKLKTDEEKIAATKAIIQKHTQPEGVDFEAVVNDLYAVDPQAAMEFDEHLTQRRTKKTQDEKASLELRLKQLEADSTDRNTWLERYAALKTPEQQAEFWTDASESKMLGALKGAGLTAQSTPEDAASLIIGAKGRADLTLKKETAATTAADREADNARMAATAAESARHNRAMEARQPATPSEPLEPVIDPATGKPILRRRSAAEGMQPATSREQPTEDERKSAGFHRQMEEAIQILDEVEGQLSEKDLYQIQTLPQEALIGLMNRGQMSEPAKRYLRAFEQFTEARMRPVSGAAISDSEFARDRRTYAKQYAETPQLSTDRKNARNSALDSLRARASRALPKTDDSGKKLQREIPGFPGSLAESTDGGKTWKRVK